VYERPRIRTCRYATRRRSIGRPYLICEGLPSSVISLRSHNAHGISNHLYIMSIISLGEMPFIPIIWDHVSTRSFSISIASFPTAICDNLPTGRSTPPTSIFLCYPGVVPCCEIEHRPQLSIPHSQDSHLYIAEDQTSGLDM
jgi:hypothetical protein